MPTDDGPQQIDTVKKNVALSQLPPLLADLREGRSEMDTIRQHLLADANVYTEIKRDLYNALKSLKVIRIDLYGSYSFDLAFKGNQSLVQIITKLFGRQLNGFLYYLLFICCFSDSAIDLFIEVESQIFARRSVQYYLQNSESFVTDPTTTSDNESVIKCIHRRSQLACELNLTSNLGVHNSQHLFFLLNFDRRIDALAVLIKYWMKVNNLIESNGMNGYAALWLLVFYLQQLEYPILPPIENFQENIAPHFIRTANLAFNTNLKYPTSNSQTVFELLHGFFVFYAEFDFENHFMSPLFGDSFPKKDFDVLFSEYFAKYNALRKFNPAQTPLKCDKIICIQDPFEICTSIPGAVSNEYFRHFQNAIRHATLVCEQIDGHPRHRKHLVTSFLAKMQEPIEPMILIKPNDPILPISIEPMERVRQMSQINQKANSPIDFDVNMCDRRKRRTIQLKYDKLDENLIKVYLNRSGSIVSENAVKKTWIRLCFEGVAQILINIFGCKLTIANQLQANSVSKTYKVTASSNVFYGREEITGKLANFELEMKTTEEILIKLQKSANRKSGKQLKMICFVWTNIEFMNRITIDLYDLCDATEGSPFNYFCHNFEERVHLLILAYLRMINGMTTTSQSSSTSCIDLSTSTKSSQASTSFAVSPTLSQASNASTAFADSTTPIQSPQATSSPLPTLIEKKIEIAGMKEKDKSIIVYSVDDDVKIIREYLQRSQPMTIFGVNGIAVKQEWFRNCVACIKHVLIKVCAVQLTDYTINLCSQIQFRNAFNLSGNSNVFVGRPMPPKGETNSIAYECMLTEKIVSGRLGNAGLRTRKSFNARVFMWSDDAKYIIVNIINLDAQRTTDNTIHSITQMLTCRIQGFISDYFKALPGGPVSAKKQPVQVEAVHVIRAPSNLNVSSLIKPAQPIQAVSSSTSGDPYSPLIASLEINFEPVQEEINILNRTIVNQSPDFINKLHLIWSQISSKFLMEIMRKIFRFELQRIDHPIKLKKTNHSHVFNIIGLYDVVFGRGKLRKSSEHMLDDEVEKSKNVTKKLPKPVSGILHIWTNDIDFKQLHIDFYNMKPNNSMFNEFLNNRIRHYLTACFQTYSNDLSGLI